MQVLRRPPSGSPALVLNADFRPLSPSESKIKKAEDGSTPAIELVQNPDILAEVSQHRPTPGMVVVGFLGRGGGRLLPLCDLAFVVASDETSRIQELHLAAEHAIAGVLEEEMTG